MTTKKYANKRLQNIATACYGGTNVHKPGSKMVKRAQRHNLSGANLTSLITRTFIAIKKDKAEIKKLNK